MGGEHHQDCHTTPTELPPIERFKIDYKELGDRIRHFSTIRTTLTTFLMTIGLAAFVEYAKGYKSGMPIAYIKWVGFLLLLMALVTCLIFSYRTEKQVWRFKKLWEWSLNPDSPYPFKSNETETWKGVRTDPINVLLVIVLIVIAMLFFSIT